MFHNARLKLTTRYLLIIMAISIAFSTFIYIESAKEFDRALRMQKFRLEHPGQIEIRVLQNGTVQSSTLPLPDPQVIEEAKSRILIELFGINIVILLLSALAGYFLAGQTLKPIQEMIDEQNRFITDASHELNTPITALKTAIEVNLRSKNLSVMQAKNVLKSNLEEVNNLQDLSDELIKLTLYQKPNGNFSIDRVYLNDIVKTAEEKVKILAEQKQITISTHIPKMYIYGDKKSLIELFVIFLDNAIKYSPHAKTVSINAAQTDKKIIIKISDEGKGIAAEDIPYIFDRFYRADKSRTKQKEKGYGLGLSIAKRIASLHNGSISVESQSNKGSTFTIQFEKKLEV